MEWIPRWEEKKAHYTAWWHHDGLVLDGFLWDDTTAVSPHAEVEPPPEPSSVDAMYTDIDWRLRHNHWRLSRRSGAADMLSIADTYFGPGSLALFLGSPPRFFENTVWFGPVYEEVDDVSSIPAFRFDPENPWWLKTKQLLEKQVAMGKGKYLVGCPDLTEGLDILASLRGTQRLLMDDLLLNPDWVIQKMEEINQVWFEAYSRIYDIIHLEDGSSTFQAFNLWGPGKTAKVQCDLSAMISPDMFNELVAPALRRQCDWCDYAIYHLDGSEAIRHLDTLLSIESLDAIEYTPDPNVPSGGNPHWYDMYTRILAAGKSIQLVDVAAEEVVPLLDAIGGKGVNITTVPLDEPTMESLAKKVEPYR